MKKLLAAAVLLAALAAFAVTAAFAGGNALRASLQGNVVGINEDPAAVAVRCPDAGGDPQAIVRVAGSGGLASAVYSGPVAFSAEHCTRLLVMTEHDVIVTQGRAGLLTLATPQGDELHAAYTQPGVLKGDLFGANEHSANGPYTITGGTGVFRGASGHGNIGALAEGPVVTIDVQGSLQVSG